MTFTPLSKDPNPKVDIILDSTDKLNPRIEINLNSDASAKDKLEYVLNRVNLSQAVLLIQSFEDEQNSND